MRLAATARAMRLHEASATTNVGSKQAAKRHVRYEAAIAALSSEHCRVTQQAGTERTGTGEYLHNVAAGIYVEAHSTSKCANAWFSGGHEERLW